MIPNQYHRFHQKLELASPRPGSQDDSLGNAPIHVAIGQTTDVDIIDISVAGAACRSMGPAISSKSVGPPWPARAAIACGVAQFTFSYQIGRKFRGRMDRVYTIELLGGRLLASGRG